MGGECLIMADFNLLWLVTGCLLMIQGSFSQPIPVLIVSTTKIDLRHCWLILGPCQFRSF